MLSGRPWIVESNVGYLNADIVGDGHEGNKAKEVFNQGSNSSQD